jgi:hypothetical protein
VIHDSEPWRDHLLASARHLAKRAKSRRVTERRSAFVERTVFFGAYAMRKLDDANKLSTSWRGTAVRCTRYPPTGKPPGWLDRDQIDRHYNFEKPQRDNSGARAFCDLVVHSFIFQEFLNDDRTIGGFFITSDKTKARGLWQFDLDTVIGLIERTAGDRPAFLAVSNPETGDTEVWTGNAEPPDEWKRKAEKIHPAVGGFIGGAEPGET